MSTLLLTPDEIIDLTGYKLPKKQSQWLSRQGIIHMIGRDGKPRVNRAHVNKVMGAGETKPVEPRELTEPDIDALRALQKK